MGPWCACRGEVAVVWYCDFEISEDADLTEGDMHLARTPISTPPVCPDIAEVRKCTRDSRSWPRLPLFVRPYFLAGGPIISLIEVHLARLSTKTTQNGPLI